MRDPRRPVGVLVLNQVSDHRFFGCRQGADIRVHLHIAAGEVIE
jgi:hypothetical protein